MSDRTGISPLTRFLIDLMAQMYGVGYAEEAFDALQEAIGTEIRRAWDRGDLDSHDIRLIAEAGRHPMEQIMALTALEAATR